MHKNRSSRALPVCCLLVSIGGFGLIEKFINKTEADAVYSSEREVNAKTYYQGTWYEINTNIETVLILGVDRFSDSSLGKSDSLQADFIALLILDKKAENFQLLHVNRDTMADIPLRDITGVEYGTRYAQIALAHIYGSNEQSRCRNTANGVSRLLYSAPVNHYVSLTMDSLAVLNDSLGGATLTLEEDMTAVDPAFRKGAVVTLQGEQALSFVRTRGALEDSSNLSRMARQRQYIGTLFEKFSSESFFENKSAEVLISLIEMMVSDLTLDQMTALENKLNYAYAGIRTLNGGAG